jgi:predicted nuclease of predicted toxin-antitoxin system
MPRRKSFDDWHREQVARDPNFDRDTEGILARRGRPRKVPLLCDESIENELIDDLRSVRDFKVTTLGSGASDRAIWQRARQDGLVIVTADEDFWNDRNYPIHASPGVIILRGRNVRERTTALARVSVASELPANYARFASSMLAQSKTRAGSAHILHKFLDTNDGSVVEAEWK